MSERRRPPAPCWAFAVLGFVLVSLYLPVVVMLVNSFISPIPGETLSLAWYQQIFSDRQIWDALLRSLQVGITASLASTCIGGLAAVAISKTQFRFGKFVQGFSFLSLIIPELVFALSLLIWFFVLKIQLSLMTVIFAHITFSLSFVLMTVSGRLSGLDSTMDDAAKDLGASEWTVLKRITLPLISTALGSAFLLAFLLSFDDFLITFFTSGVGSDTLPIRLYVAMKTGLTPKLSALASLMFLFSLGVILILVKLRGLKTISESK